MCCVINRVQLVKKCKGEKNGMFGKQHTKESKRKNSESNKITWQKKKIENNRKYRNF